MKFILLMQELLPMETKYTLTVTMMCIDGPAAKMDCIFRTDIVSNARQSVKLARKSQQSAVAVMEISFTLTKTVINALKATK